MVKLTEKERQMANSAFDASLELKGISMVLAGLGNQLDRKSNTLSASALEDALYAIQRHLERIASDLENITGELNT